MIGSLIAQWLSTCYVGAVSLALSVFIGRQVGPASFGEYSVALAIGGILAIFIDGGMRNLLWREHTRASPQLAHISDKLSSIAITHSLVVALVLSLLSMMFFGGHIAIALGTIWCFFGVVRNQYLSAKIRGHGRMAMDAAWQVGQRSFSAACITLTIILGFDSPWQILTAWAFGGIIINLLFSQTFKRRPAFVLPFEIYRVVFPLLWIDIATAIYFRSDMVILQWCGVPQEWIGQYAAAYRLIEAVILIANPISLLLFRRMRLQNDNVTFLRRNIPEYTVLAGILGIIIALTITVLADCLTDLTYGATYNKVADLLTILSWAFPFVMANAILTQAALALDIEMHYALAASVAAIFNVVFNCVFIMHYGTAAAAWITIVTEAVLFMALSYQLRKRMNQQSGQI